jgi:hypothetical protein
MVRFLVAALVLGVSLLASQASFAQVQVGVDPNEGGVQAKGNYNNNGRSSRPNTDQLDRIEDKIDMLTRQMDRVEKKLGSRPAPGKIYEVTSSVDMDCVNSIYDFGAGFEERVGYPQRCRTGNLEQLQNTCRQLSKTSNTTCYNKCVDYWDESSKKADMIDACATYVFECNGK